MSVTERGQHVSENKDSTDSSKIPLRYLSEIVHATPATIDLVISQAENAAGRQLSIQEHEALLEIFWNTHPI